MSSLQCVLGLPQPPPSRTWLKPHKNNICLIHLGWHLQHCWTNLSVNLPLHPPLTRERDPKLLELLAGVERELYPLLAENHVFRCSSRELHNGIGKKETN